LFADHPLATTLGVDHTALFDIFWDEFTAALAHDFLSVQPEGLDWRFRSAVLVAAFGALLIWRLGS
jgi:hypothetical protein